MAFDLSTAVEYNEEQKAIPTTTFDLATAQESNPDTIKETFPIAKFLRSIFRDTPINQFKTQQYMLENKDKLPKITEGDSLTAGIKKWEEFLKPREEEIAKQGVVQQLEDPMTLAIATSGMAAPAETIAMVGAFSIADHFFNARRWIEENKPKTAPLIKELVEIGDFVAKGAIIGGGVLRAKQFVKNRLSELNLPKSVNIEPATVDVIKDNKQITETLGINKDHINASLSSETPISVPTEKILDLATDKKWVETKELLTGKVEIPKDFKSSEQAIDYGINNKKEVKIIQELKNQYVEGQKQIDLLNKQSAEARKSGNIELSDKLDNEGFILAQKNQLYREAYQASEGVITPVSMTAKEKISPSPEITQPIVSEQQKVKTPVSVPSIESITRERGFIKSIKESENVPKEVKVGVEELPTEIKTYEVYTDAKAIAKAQERVKQNPEEALSYVLTSEKLDKDITTTGLELMRKYAEQGKTEQEVNVAATLAERGTTAGQYIQAYSILDRLSPEGVLVFAQREINKGLAEGKPKKIIEPELADKLKNQAKIIQETPYGYQKIKEVNKLMEMIATKKGKSAIDWITDLINVPRTVMSSMLDFSFGFRQGLFLMPSYIKEWGSAFSKQFGVFAKEKNYDVLMDSIMKHPDFTLAENSGISFTDIRGTFGKLEEQYMGVNLAEKIPIVGGTIRATNRAYTGMANKMRMDIFSKMVKDMENIGLEPRSNKRLLQEIATFVNAGTGRGGLGGVLKQAAPLLNGIFYSPRLMSSRLTLLNPAYYVTRSPGLRKQSLKSLFSFMGLWTSVLAIAKLNGLDVGTDPRSSDFGKIKIGNTRIDFGGGFAQWIRMFGQQITGEYVSSTTGKKLTLGEGYKPLTRYDILMRQLESKEAPVISFITDILRQQDFTGQKINIAKELADRFTPMVAQDIYDLWQEDPDLIPLGLLPIFGIGVQTYKQKKKNKF